MVAQGLDASGFTLYAKLKQKGAVSSTGAYFPASNSLTSEGARTYADASTDATGWQYSSFYKVELHVTATGNPCDVTLGVVVARDSLDSTGSWTERGTANYTVTASAGTTNDQYWTYESKTDTLSSDSLSSTGNNWDLRIKQVTVSSPGPLQTTEGQFAVHGFSSSGDPNYGVRWSVSTESLASMTPTTEDFITWEAMEVEA